MMRRFISSLVLAGLPALWLAAPAMADGSSGGVCDIPAATVANVQSQLFKVVNLSDDNGGIFKPNRMWSAVVDRFGVLCSVISTAPVTSQQDPWPGSRAIAIAKASTANDFSNSALALYNTSGQVIGGLGVSGDSSCADHAIAYRMRLFAGFNNTPNDDNIVYAAAGTTPAGFEQPHCFPQDLTPTQITSPPSQ